MILFGDTVGKVLGVRVGADERQFRDRIYRLVRCCKVEVNADRRGEQNYG